MLNTNTENSGLLVVIAWINAGLGSLFSEPVLSGLAYIGSIAGSVVYIYTTIRKSKQNEKNT